ncbi:MAG TPA: aspartate carbamoyltransferase, partial [Ilumatobacteraceae bacterium]
HIAIVGDIKHSRVARSDVWAFAALGARVTLVAPHTLLPPSLDGWPVDVAHSIDAVVGSVDVLYMLRMQRERMHEALVPSLREYTACFGLTPPRAARLQPHALVMHPGPMNRGVEIAVDPSELPGSVIGQQVTNGVSVRMAVLFHLLGSGSGLAGES